MNPVLAVLVPTLNSRPWQKLVAELERQAHASANAVVIALPDDGQRTSGSKRQELCLRADAAGAEYQAFVDDDDWVAPDYVDKLVAGCASGVDVIGFDLQYVNATAGTEQTWRFGLHENDRSTGRMCVNHLCAWRCELARKVAWCPHLGYGDDLLWFQPLYHAGLVKTCRHVPATLYHYRYSKGGSANQNLDSVKKSLAYAGSGLGCYRLNGGVYLQDGWKSPKGLIRLRGRTNAVYEVAVDSVKNALFHTVVIK